MPISVFSCPTFGPAADTKPHIVTPLGTLTLDAEFDGVLLGDLKPSSCHHLQHGGYLLNWTLNDVTAELLLCRPQLRCLTAWPWMIAGVWRLRAAMLKTFISGERPEFSCCWEPGYHWTEGGPNSGEGLDAQTWETDRAKVTIGTTDAEWLAGHAKRGVLPPRWADLLDFNYGGIVPDIDTGKFDPVVYLENGFRIVLSPLESGEMCQVQFLVAWSSDVDNVFTWFVVDQSPEEILPGIGCQRLAG